MNISWFDQFMTDIDEDYEIQSDLTYNKNEYASEDEYFKACRLQEECVEECLNSALSQAVEEYVECILFRRRESPYENVWEAMYEALLQTKSKFPKNIILKDFNKSTDESDEE